MQILDAGSLAIYRPYHNTDPSIIYAFSLRDAPTETGKRRLLPGRLRYKECYYGCYYEKVTGYLKVSRKVKIHKKQGRQEGVKLHSHVAKTALVESLSHTVFFSFLLIYSLHFSPPSPCILLCQREMPMVIWQKKVDFSVLHGA